MQVMDYVGSPYFHKDVGRLVVCKRWFVIVRTVIFKHLRLSPKTLRRLLSSRHAVRRLLLVKENLRFFDLEMKGFDYWGSIPDVEKQSRSGNAPPHPEDINAAFGNLLCITGAKYLNEDLAKLAKITKESRKLHSIRIEATTIEQDSFPSALYYLSSSAIHSLLSVDNLMALDLDLRTICLTISAKGENNPSNFHLCKTIGTLLSTLTRLRLRMRSICADALKPKHHHYSNLRLSEVIVNLSLSYVARSTTIKAHSSNCDSTAWRIKDLETEVETQAKALVPKMTSPKVFRILTHSFLHLEPLSYDVLTGKRMKLTEEMAWEDDGEIVEDGSDGEESSDISSPSD